MTIKNFLAAALLLCLFAACTKNDQLKENTLDLSNQSLLKEKMAASSPKSANGTKAVVYKAEFITNATSNEANNTYYFFNTGNKQLDVAFVPKDPYRGGRLNITYAIDDELTNDNGLSGNEIERAIDAAMATWQAQNCSKLQINKVDYSGDLGWLSSGLNMSGSNDWVADIQHSGFLPGAFFDVLAPGGSSSILAVTFSFIWFDGDGNALDMDNNGKYDLAFSEIYYNDAFSWRTNNGAGIDIETIALHEVGHGLGQAHFGKAFYNASSGKLQIAPLAVMNATYSGQQRTLLGTDKAGHCAIWGQWPSK